MKIVSPLMSKASGSLAGMTASHNKGGMYLRQRATPTNPNSPQQQIIRGFVNQLANLWVDTLTSAQRKSWDDYAVAVGVIDTVGNTIYLTGLNHYLRSNVPRLQDGLDRVDDAPTIFNLGDFTEPTIAASEATQQISIAFENTDDWANEDGSAMLVNISRPQNNSINFFKGPYRHAGSVLGNSTTPPTSPETLGTPFAFVTGQRVFGHLRVTRADGRLSMPFRTYALATA